ncbi:type II toxin -antitoxin system TacA 1-like antitoxin [Anatilimnocola floriformis]|uniref:type II toxin -antitoxin system TacA 1-like antitoxin n=1 Tax=Anatilimnocola floriformis TaxID=2948575 RepID=UPI0020C5A37A|nr:DUF1778 domain-containing protein [Anatilimnocola floriformis]
MAKAKSKAKSKAKKTSPLMVRLDERSKSALAKAAKLRQVSVSDYVRLVTVPQAEREIEAEEQQTILLSPTEQLEFWQALQATPRRTPAQQELGRLMRGSK